MRKKKLYPGILLVLVMAVLFAIPAMAAEDAGGSDGTTEDNGFHQDPDSGDWYYYTDGRVDTSVTEVVKGTVDDMPGWWNVVDGKVTRVETVAKNSNGWWYIDANGMVDFSYNGFAENENGLWYCEDGKVTFAKQDILKDTTGAIGDTGAWYYVIDSQVQTDFTGLGNFRNANGWWYITKGQVDFSYNGVDKNKNGWFYVTDGKAQLGFTGLANYKNTNGWWYIRNGAVDFSHNGVDKNKNGWFYVTGGKVQFGFTGLANYKNENGWWYIKNGVVDFSHNGVDKNKNGWFYVTDGKVQFGYTGVANYKNANGWWYVKKGAVDFSFNGLGANKNGGWYVKSGKVDFSYNGTYDIGDTTYTLSGGKVILSSHRAGQSLTSLDLGILTANKGTVLSRTLTQSEFHQIIDKYLSSSYVKNTSYNTNSEGFIWNGGTRWDCSSATLYLMNDYLLTYDEAYQTARKNNPSATTDSLTSSALASVGKKAGGAYPETGNAAPTNSVSQAMSWGNPVYTYQTVSQLQSDSPGNLRYGDFLFYGTISGSTIKISHVAVYLGQYYLDNGDTGYYQLENDYGTHGTTKEGRSDGVRISALRTTELVHVARIF